MDLSRIISNTKTQQEGTKIQTGSASGSWNADKYGCRNACRSGISSPQTGRLTHQHLSHIQSALAQKKIGTLFLVLNGRQHLKILVLQTCPTLRVCSCHPPQDTPRDTLPKNMKKQNSQVQRFNDQERPQTARRNLTHQQSVEGEVTIAFFIPGVRNSNASYTQLWTARSSTTCKHTPL